MTSFEEKEERVRSGSRAWKENEREREGEYDTRSIREEEGRKGREEGIRRERRRVAWSVMLERVQNSVQERERTPSRSQ